VTVNGQAVGSDLIGIDPVAMDADHDPWFHNRPSAVAQDLDGDGSADALGPADATTSGGSNKGAFNEDLVAVIQQRKDTIAKREGVDPATIPADAVTTSASGLDPQISPAYAELQVPRAARENGLSEQQVRALVEENTTGRGLGFLGESGVNVLKLNLAVQAATH
jgi:K+-transporting ATPase ATPase C chain